MTTFHSDAMTILQKLGESLVRDAANPQADVATLLARCEATVALIRADSDKTEADGEECAV